MLLKDLLPLIPNGRDPKTHRVPILIRSIRHPKYFREAIYGPLIAFPTLMGTAGEESMIVYADKRVRSFNAKEFILHTQPASIDFGDPTAISMFKQLGGVDNFYVVANNTTRFAKIRLGMSNIKATPNLLILETIDL